jgi:hypothetical protein
VEIFLVSLSTSSHALVLDIFLQQLLYTWKELEVFNEFSCSALMGYKESCFPGGGLL